MIVVIILGFLAMIFAWLEDTGQYKHGLKISFGLIFLFLALRYNFGNDYPAYLTLFREINGYEDINFFAETQQMELGWLLLCWLCKPIGFFGMTAILALINCLVYYKFFKKYVPAQYYWFAIFLYIFGPGYMMICASAMRQNIAILLFIFSLDYLYKKNILKYSACILLASFFHFTAIILLLVFFIGLVNMNLRLKAGIAIMTGYILLFVFGSYLLQYLNSFIEIYFAKYVIYQETEKLGSGMGLLFTSFLLMLIIYYNQFQTNEKALIFKIGILSFLFIPLSMLIMLSGRVGMYFQPALIAIYPIIFTNMKNTLLKNAVLFVLLFITIYNFYIFFQSDIWKDAFGAYQTILSAPQWY